MAKTLQDKLRTLYTEMYEDIGNHLDIFHAEATLDAMNAINELKAIVERSLAEAESTIAYLDSAPYKEVQVIRKDFEHLKAEFGL